MKIIRRLLGETIGTFVTLALSLGVICAMNLTDAASLSSTIKNVIIAGTFALSYAIMACCMNEFSGGHFNPAVSLGVWGTSILRRKERRLFHLYDILLDFVGQAIGVAGAFFFVAMIFGKVAFNTINDVQQTLINLSPKDYIYNAIAIEAILTAIFTFVVCVMNDQKKMKVGGLISGLALGVLTLLALPLTSACFNPFRFLGALAVRALLGDFSYCTLNYYLLFIASPFAGAFLAGLLYGILTVQGKKVEAVKEAVIEEDEDEMPQEYKEMYEKSVKEQPKEEVVEEVKEVEVKQEPVIEEEPVVIKPQPTPAKVSVDEDGNLSFERKSFEEKVAEADPEILEKYNAIRNEVLAYSEIKSRVSFEGETFRAHREAYVFITLRGKGIKCCFKLDPKQFNESAIPIEDASNKRKYQEYPCVLKVKSDLSLKRALQLVNQTLEENGFVKE